MHISFEDKRFLIALSFSGDKRPFIAALSNFLRDFINQDSIFYDYFYEGELSGPDLDLKLQKIYGTQSDLIAVFVSQAYQLKEWCFGVEWRVIRDLIKKMKDKDKVKFFRFDEAILEGLLSIDGYIHIGKRSPIEIGTILLKILKSKGKIIIPHDDEVVIRIPNNSLSSEEIEKIFETIKKISGRSFLVHGVEKGSTIIKLGMFENSFIKLVRWVTINKSIGEYKVLDINVNDRIVYDTLPQDKKTNIARPFDGLNNRLPNKNKLREILATEGLTQAKLVRASGVSKTTINRLVNVFSSDIPLVVTKLKIVDSINQIIGQNKYKVDDVFLE